MSRERRVIIVSNRLPVTVRTSHAGPKLEHSSGGLVTAMCPVLRQHSGYWIGWTGTERTEEIVQLFDDRRCDNYKLVPLYLTGEERNNFYLGFSNEILWPLFHDLQSRCNFDPAYWKTYVGVNDKFADTLLKVAELHDFVWVQDYHLKLVADSVRKVGANLELAYFHYIPFPSPDIFEKLPWRAKILHALLQYNLLGFQTKRDLKNFVSCVKLFVPDAEISNVGDQTSVSLAGNRSLLGVFPIGIDFSEFADGAEDAQVIARAAQIKKDISGCSMLLGVDRLDYTKGIPERLRAFRYLLESQASICEKITLVQVVVPSRIDIPKYCELRLDIERLVSSINGQFGSPGWVPIHYIHRELDRPELLAYYRAADIAVVTPLKDGMNLVCKEYCAAQVDESGVLILSEFAGAASQLKDGALLVNPTDLEGVGKAIQSAIQMSVVERRQRMQRLRTNIKNEDVYQWAKRFFFESRNVQRSLARVSKTPPQDDPEASNVEE
ncbi:MAG: trehalose-6-phosphate synthase, partial [Acidobacteria bacterium]